MTTLSLQNIQIPFSKKGSLPSFSFQVEHPAQIFIAGSNGIGKSSFLRMLQFPHAPSSGTIRLNSNNLSQFSSIDKARRIGFLEQRHAVEFPVLVKDLVVMGRFPYKKALESYSLKDYELVEQALHELGIAYTMGKNFLSLSGGEQQLCMLAQLTLQNPDLLLLDEPTQSLDLYNKEKIFDWMEKQVQKGKIILCATHDLPWLRQRNGYLLLLNENHIQLDKLTDETVSIAVRQLTQGIY